LRLEIIDPELPWITLVADPIPMQRIYGKTTKFQCFHQANRYGMQTCSSIDLDIRTEEIT